VDRTKQVEAINLLTFVSLRLAELALAADRIRDESDKLATRVAKYLAELEG